MTRNSNAKRRHSSDEFVDFLHQLVGLFRPKQEIHVILDNLSAHKTQEVARFLQEHPNLELHFTPTYSSWLNQVEIWFSRIEREVIARGVFTSVRDLARKRARFQVFVSCLRLRSETSIGQAERSKPGSREISLKGESQ
jgi:transposase